MHTGEEWFQFGWPQYALLLLVTSVYLVLVFTNKMPSMNTFKEFVDTINTSGAQILVLGIFTAWSITISMRLFFHLLGLREGQITKGDVIVSGAVSYVTGQLSGQFIGALLKTMSGGKANGAPPPIETPPVDIAPIVAAPTPVAPLTPSSITDNDLAAEAKKRGIFITP
jgi:hypothetical protein